MKPWRKSFFVFLITIYVVKGHSQNPEPATYRTAQLEALSEKKDSEPEDDSYETDMETLSKHPVNMNTATEEDLVQMHLLNVLQIRNFFSYRNLLGPLVSLHELQAVPGWDLETIRRLLPFIMVGRDESLYSALRERWKGGDAAVLLRSSRVLEKSRGFEKPVLPGTTCYIGSQQKLFIRYTYNYKQLLSYGLTGEKDAGEPFFRGAQRFGFDFYSFHFFLRHLGIIRALAIGDFTVNLGQGLIQWQTISFTKSSQVFAIKREAICLKPYHSAGEFNFHRGLGISLQKGRWQTSLFISSRKISANLEPDNSGREGLFSSFQNSGYHRTAVEIADRNNVRQISAGGNIRFSTNQFNIGFNWISFSFSRAFQKPDELYNLFSFKGKKLADYSIDYGYTHRNLHLFGEFAVDSRRSLALIQGALISLNEKTDLVFLYRNISAAYQSLYGDAFTENTAPNNEKGLYAGFAFRPAPGLQVNIYYDLFVFPWLKYRVDAPSGGKDLLIQAVYQPTKTWHFSTLYKQERKTGNSPVLNTGTHSMETVTKQRWRIETEFVISRSVSFNNRMEFAWLKSHDGLPVQGFLGTAGFSYLNHRISGNMAVTVFETADYDTRIYAYEPDLRYNFSLPAFYGRGFHYYINLHRNFSRLSPVVLKPFKISGWIKWSQTYYPAAVSLGSGLDEINGNRKSEIKLQILVQWR